MRPASKKILREYGIVIAAAVLVALLIRFYLIEAYRIPTSSMRPTLEAGDTIFVLKWPLGFDRKPARGDIVVLDSRMEPGREHIKRVVGLAGDRVEVRAGNLMLNDKPELPDYPTQREAPLLDDFGPETVPEGSAFVLPDLRSAAAGETRKRRSWGIVPLASLRGKARWIWLSIEPRDPSAPFSLIPRFRFDRMLRRIP